MLGRAACNFLLLSGSPHAVPSNLLIFFDRGSAPSTPQAGGQSFFPLKQIIRNHFLPSTSRFQAFMTSVFEPLWAPLPTHSSHKMGGGWRQRLLAAEKAEEEEKETTRSHDRTPRRKSKVCETCLLYIKNWGGAQE